jgi:alanine dehydrogenase
VIKDAWIKQGTHINAIGADAKGKQELEPSLTKRAKVAVDDITQASYTRGDQRPPPRWQLPT